jgi:hypothetical protein
VNAKKPGKASKTAASPAKKAKKWGIHMPQVWKTQNALCETTPLPWRKLQYPWDVNCRAAFIVTSSCTLRCSETQLSLAQFHCLERVCVCS